MSRDNLRHQERKLRKLPHSLQLAFAAACCERAYPNYVRFHQLTHWGDPSILRISLDRAWDFIENGIHVSGEFEQLEQKCEAVTPDLDDFDNAANDLEAAAAQEAAFMIRLLLQFCGDCQFSYALRIVTFATDTIDMYVQVMENLDPADPQLDEKIAHHSLMQEEIRNQESDEFKLAHVKSKTDLREFRVNARHPEKSNVGHEVLLENGR